MKLTKLLGVAGLAMMAAVPAAQADQLADIREAGVIHIATDMGVPPYGMMDENLKPVGSDVETAKLLAEDLGVKLELVPVTGPNRIPFLLTGKADLVISSFSVNEERAKVIDFSKPYGKIQIVIAGTASEEAADYAGLAGKTVAVTRGTTADTGLTEGVKAAGVKAEIVRFDDDATLATAASSGQVDIVANIPSLVATINEKRPNEPLEIKFPIKLFPYAIGLRKNEPELKDYLDEWVETNLANGKLNEIYKTWHGADLPDMND